MILFLIAYILLLPLTIMNYFVVGSNNYFKSTAINIDRFANREFRALWNKYLKDEYGYHFGNENETISSALGKNQRAKTLSKLGVTICKILDWLDKDHCKKSIKEL